MLGALAVSLPLAIVATKRRGGPLDRVAVAVAAIPAYRFGLLLSCSLSFSSAGSLPRALAGTPTLFYPPSRSGHPGLGTFLITDIIARDFAYVQAVVVLTELVFVVVNLLIDIIYRVIDPRIGAETRSTLIVVTGLVALALFSPIVAAYDPTAINIPNRLSAPSTDFPLGSNTLERDILPRLLHGARWS
ncbi:ABC transporter permease subunit [uncultured Roseobacter sp.]|uniref:ABC transporter permease subunit n=1 Tax=uncultured Roseobacter sp. TaxID=114847 RepID=UPI00262CACB3|nr:ABC transporter permease subunit [uncultured Roseobacter sp.]